MISYGRQDISKEDIRSVIEVLALPLTQGSQVPTFERKIRLLFFKFFNSI